MKDVVETDDWKLRCFFQWMHHSVKCTTCGGRGETGGGFKDIDGPQVCNSCFGSGVKSEAPSTPVPEIPAGIQEHMRRAWFDYVNQDPPSNA
jgi:DnaJ-class molecular chaperone